MQCKDTSVKSDVFSFGALVLEIVSGKKCDSFICNGGNEDGLLSYVSSKVFMYISFLSQGVIYSNSHNKCKKKKKFCVLLICQYEPSYRHGNIGGRGKFQTLQIPP